VAAKYTEVKLTIVEYTFARLASMLNVGPRVRLDMSFDLICYRDCLEFYMEACESIEYRPAGLTFEDMGERLKESLFTFHRFHLIHKDIKPRNIVYSPYHSHYVFCDFGISCPVLETVGFSSKTYREGTEKYMSADMMGIGENGEGFVDLYFNDVFALYKTL